MLFRTFHGNRLHKDCNQLDKRLGSWRMDAYNEITPAEIQASIATHCIVDKIANNQIAFGQHFFDQLY